METPKRKRKRIRVDNGLSPKLKQVGGRVENSNSYTGGEAPEQKAPSVRVDTFKGGDNGGSA